MSTDDSFLKAVDRYKKLRAPIYKNQKKIGKFEIFVKFEQHCYPLWGTYQQAVVGDINVPKDDYMDEEHGSWMWSWIHGNKKWHAWNFCKGIAKEEAKLEFVRMVDDLEQQIDKLLVQWKKFSE